MRQVTTIIDSSHFCSYTGWQIPSRGGFTVNRTLMVILLIAIVSLFIGVGAAYAQAGDGHATPPNTSTLFTDVPKDHWAYNDIKYLVDRGIITGLPGGKYNGDQPLTRYSAAALIARTIQYLQNNPDTVTPKDLAVLKDLIFKVSDKLDKLQTQVNSMQGGNSSALAAQVTKNQQAIQQLDAQVQTMASSNTSKLANRVNANFIISITALLVGIIGIALITLRW